MFHGYTEFDRERTLIFVNGENRDYTEEWWWILKRTANGVILRDANNRGYGSLSQKEIFMKIEKDCFPVIFQVI